MSAWLVPPAETTIDSAHPPTFSVIIPTYQLADLVGRAVDSALEQTSPAKEVIVCDDGSTDGTGRVLRAYGERIRVVTKENGGLASAKNAAARVATGDFVAVLDADDTYLPGRLEALGELAAARPDLDILNTDVHLEHEGVVVARLTDRVPFPTSDQRAGILERNFMWSGAAIRRERLLEIGCFDESVDFADDWDCWRRLIFTGSRAGLVDEPLAVYRIHERSMSADRQRYHAGIATVLERSRQEALSRHERSVLGAAQRRNEQERRLVAAESALMDRRRGSRGALLAVALGRGFSLRTRLKAAAAWVSPEAARRRLAALERRGRISRLARPVPGRPESETAAGAAPRPGAPSE